MNWKVFTPLTYSLQPGKMISQGYWEVEGFGPLTLDIPNGGWDQKTPIQGGTKSVIFNQGGSYKTDMAVYRVAGVNSGANGWVVGDYAVVIYNFFGGGGNTDNGGLANMESFFGFSKWPFVVTGNGQQASQFTCIKVLPVVDGGAGTPNPGTGPYNPGGITQPPSGYGGYGQPPYYPYPQPPVIVPAPSLLSRLDPNIIALGGAWLLNNSQKNSEAKAEREARQEALDAQLEVQRMAQEARDRREEREYRLQLVNQFGQNPKLVQNADPQLLELLTAQNRERQ